MQSIRGVLINSVLAAQAAILPPTARSIVFRDIDQETVVKPNRSKSTSVHRVNTRGFMNQMYEIDWCVTLMRSGLYEPARQVNNYLRPETGSGKDCLFSNETTERRG